MRRDVSEERTGACYPDSERDRYHACYDCGRNKNDISLRCFHRDPSPRMPTCPETTLEKVPRPKKH